MDITIAIERIDSPDAVALIEELSLELEHITGNSGKGSFDHEDMNNKRSVFVMAREHDANSKGIGSAIGCGAFRELSCDTAEIKRMYVRNKSAGTGSKILEYLEEQARTLLYHRIVLETRRCNEKAVGFYLHNGYKMIDNYEKYKGRQEAVCFEKILLGRV